MIPTIPPLGSSQFSLDLLPTNPEQTQLEKALHSGNFATIQKHLDSPHKQQLALDFAIREDKREIAEYILKGGGIPQPEHMRDASEAIRPLLTYARRKQILYPNGVDRNGYTDLDRALYGYDLDTARKILASRSPSLKSGVSEAWAGAINKTNPELDVLRALLLLGEADKDRGFRLQENFDISLKDKIKDPALIRVMKEVPYYPPKLGNPQNFNSRTNSVCRHLTSFKMDQLALDPRFKFPYSYFQSIDAISKHVNVPEEYIINTRNLSTDVYLVKHKIGAFIADRFKEMEGKNESRMQVLMESTNHAMGLELHIKKKNGQQTYVVRFFDPNLTTTHARNASDTKEYFIAHDVREYIDGENLLKTYFPEEKTMAMMFVRPPENVLKGNTEKRVVVSPDRRLTSPLNDNDVDATVIWYLMKEGFAGNLLDLEKSIANLSETERITMLSEPRMGMSALAAAVGRGQTHAIKVFDNLLKLIPDAGKRAEIVAASGIDHINGVPALFLAMQEEDYAEGIIEFGNLVFKHLPDGVQRLTILAAKDAEGMPGLSAAMASGRVKPMDAFDHLLEKIPSQKDRADLVLEATCTNNANATPGLNFALNSGFADAVAKSQIFLKHLPDESQRVAFIAAKDADQTPGLSLALENNRFESISNLQRLTK